MYLAGIHGESPFKSEGLGEPHDLCASEMVDDGSCVEGRYDDLV